MLAASIPHREICGQLHMGRGVLALPSTRRRLTKEICRMQMEAA